MDKGFILLFVADSTSILLYGKLCFFKDTICLILATAVSDKKDLHNKSICPLKNKKRRSCFLNRYKEHP